MVTTSFTPIASAIGGALIGLAAVLLMAFSGTDCRGQRHRGAAIAAL